MSPDFLFRVVSDPPGTAPGAPYRLSDLELASRISFFLWSSIPDDELLAVPMEGGLQDPEVVELQVRRMLERGGVNTDNFGDAMGTLRLEPLASV